MATDLKPPVQTAPEGDPCVVLRGIGWKGYTTMLRLRGERPSPRMIYLDGDLWLMSPAFPHEYVAERCSTFVKLVTLGLGIRCVPAGQTTFRRRKKRGGVEGDSTYYLANADRLRGVVPINLRTDPPPDLAVEVVHTSDASHALKVYRRLRVPEVWVAEDEEVRVLAWKSRGYQRVAASLAFPFLTAGEISDWIFRPYSGDETRWAGELLAWVQRDLARRFREQSADPPRET